MVDLHCHVLPGVDDGAKTEEIALEMCRMAVADGVTDLVATPHANYTYSYNRESLQKLLEPLQTKVPDLRLHLGCDFHLSFENVEDALTHPGRYNIGNSRALLIEFSDFNIPPNVLHIFAELQDCNHRLVITHPERNPILLRHPKTLKEMIYAGACVQITANSLTGWWGKESQKYCETLLKENLVRVIASDAHGTKRRTPILSEARSAAARLVGAATAQKLVQENPAALLHNQPFPD